eukprot:gene11312-biopygen1725
MVCTLGILTYKFRSVFPKHDSVIKTSLVLRDGGAAVEVGEVGVPDAGDHAALHVPRVLLRRLPHLHRGPGAEVLVEPRRAQHRHAPRLAVDGEARDVVDRHGVVPRRVDVPALRHDLVAVGHLARVGEDRRIVEPLVEPVAELLAHLAAVGEEGVAARAAGVVGHRVVQRLKGCHRREVVLVRDVLPLVRVRGEDLRAPRAVVQRAERGLEGLQPRQDGDRELHGRRGVLVVLPRARDVRLVVGVPARTRVPALLRSLDGSGTTRNALVYKHFCSVCDPLQGSSMLAAAGIQRIQIELGHGPSSVAHVVVRRNAKRGQRTEHRHPDVLAGDRLPVVEVDEPVGVPLRRLVVVRPRVLPRVGVVAGEGIDHLVVGPDDPTDKSQFKTGGAPRDCLGHNSSFFSKDSTQNPEFVFNVSIANTWLALVQVDIRHGRPGRERGYIADKDGNEDP